ncbi:hypothetical protein DFP73DRAFT_596857 [Morchella snyderi]|nr:hypothetical protein DFP73DRAFT_596857 [Morchella snyderi]
MSVVHHNLRQDLYEAVNLNSLNESLGLPDLASSLSRKIPNMIGGRGQHDSHHPTFLLLVVIRQNKLLSAAISKLGDDITSLRETVAAPKATPHTQTPHPPIAGYTHCSQGSYGIGHRSHRESETPAFRPPPAPSRNHAPNRQQFWTEVCSKWALNRQQFWNKHAPKHESNSQRIGHHPAAGGQPPLLNRDTTLSRRHSLQHCQRLHGIKLRLFL